MVETLTEIRDVRVHQLVQKDVKLFFKHFDLEDIVGLGEEGGDVE